MSLIEFKNISKAFGENSVLSGVDLKIQQGETLTILGGSGTGKSVFLKLLLGVLAPDEGSVFFQGNNLADMTEDKLIGMRRKIGMLFQGSALFDSLTVFENIVYPLREHFSYSDRQLNEIAAAKLAMVGLPGLEDKYPGELSGGMKKRVGLARAIATDPSVILYDEPTTGLDPANTRRINSLIVKLQEQLKVTSVVVTHDMESAFEVTDRIALLSNKCFAFVGTKEEANDTKDQVVQRFIKGEMETRDG